MIETVLNATAIQPIESEVFGTTLSRRGNRGQGGPIQNLYRCAGRTTTGSRSPCATTGSGARWSS